MGYGVGLAPDGSGNGTTPADLQRWIWSLYRVSTGQIARGLEVTGRSNMSYAVAPGVVIIPTGTAMAVAVPVDAVNVNTPAAPSSGSRTDYIYVGQDGAVMVGTSQPANTALLDKRTVPANITATTATTSLLGNRKYAPLYGGTMGRLVNWYETRPDLSEIPDARTRVFSTTLTVDSDRLLSWTLQQSYELARNANTGSDGWKVASMLWEYVWDGVGVYSTEIGVEPYAETKTNSYEFTVPAGTHTLEIYRSRRLVGIPGDVVVHRRGGANNWPGTSFKIVDLGGIA